MQHPLIRLDSEIPEDLYLRVLTYGFWIMFVPFVARIYPILLTYLWQRYHARVCTPLAEVWGIHLGGDLQFHLYCDTFCN